MGSRNINPLFKAEITQDGLVESDLLLLQTNSKEQFCASVRLRFHTENER